MTVINRTFSNHLVLSMALHRLTNAIVRHNNPVTEPAGSELLNMFDDIGNKEQKANLSAVEKIRQSGDIKRVAEELYNPSTDIFDSDIVPAKVFPPDLGDPFDYPTEIGADDNSCTSVYRIRNDGKIYAEIKNYHTLTVIDYSVTSLTYPVLAVDSLTSAGLVYGGRLGSPFAQDSLDTVAQIYDLSYPYEVIYSTYNNGIENIETSAYIEGMFFPSEVGYRTYDNGIENIETTANITAMSFPTIVAYIPYTIEPEGISSSGTVYALFFGT